MGTSKTRLNLVLDAQLQKEANEIFNELGINQTTAIVMYYKQVVRQRKIPFELQATSYEPNTETLLAMNETEELLRGDLSKNEEPLSEYLLRMRHEAGK
ncbi:MAG: type II toxin-antitoxin system RelB/DinJ family antitoxin [Streptococcaceae bacterium]|nr:type II toxin-antitoxin system RelB/DinJ family antitoxin [Streptococcaceae bacterium]